MNAEKNRFIGAHPPLSAVNSFFKVNINMIQPISSVASAESRKTQTYKTAKTTNWPPL